MRPLRAFPLSVLASALLIGTSVAQQFAPTVRIVNAIDETQLVTLQGNTSPAANAKNDRGQVSSTLPMTDLILVLSRSAEQQAAFDKYVASQYEPGSPDFHHWLAPAEVGTNFGPSEIDIATVSNWLTGHGFTIGGVSKDRMSIRFSGTAGQVESTFHAEIHNLELNGIPHIANMSDPQIPAALAPAVVGVKGLHNFFPKPLHKTGGMVTRDSATGKWQRVADAAPAGNGAPQAAKAGGIHSLFTVTDPNNAPLLVEDVVPYDFATIYNVLPLWSASTPIDGTGQKIAIAGTSDINLSDIAAFRAAFGLPATPVPQLLAGVNGTDPGICTSTSATAVCGIGDLEENSLDVEWSGAVAKGAQIILVTSGSKSSSDDTVYDSSSYVISGKSTPIAPVLNVSYGQCELYNGAASNTAYNTLWQTAASEGVAVFVAAGDQGSAVCDYGNSSGAALTLAPAMAGLAVSGLASSPYDTAVGGTDFNWCNPTVESSGNLNGCQTSAPYWSTTNASTLASALGYIPEVPWNDTCTTPAGIGYLASFASYFGISGVNSAESACNFVANDSLFVYQNTQGQIDLSSWVNVVGGSGGASNCSNNTTTISLNGTETLGTCTNGWTKPSYQTALTPADGERDLPDVSFFAANGLWNSSYLICVSEVLGGTCTYSATAENTYMEVGGTSVASPAMAGVMALINQKTGAPQGNPNTELYKLAGQQSYASCSSEGPPSSSCYFHDVNQGTIAMPCQAGTPNCTVVTSGDTIGVLSGYGATTGYDEASGLGSLNVANVVNAFPTLAGAGTASVTVTPSLTSITANQTLTVSVTVASKPAGGTTPTGTVTLTSGSYTSAVGTLSGGSFTFTIPADSLSSGTDALTVSYSGDSTYGTATGSANVAVSKLAATVTVTPSAMAISSNQTLTVTGTVAGSGGTPTGTVTLSGGGYLSASTTLSSGSYSITIPANSLSGGADPLNVAYSGDATYSTQNGSAIVTVTSVSVLTPTVTVTPASTTVDSNASLSVAAKVTGAGVTPTGTVTLTSGSYTSAAGTLSGGSFTFTIPAGSLANGSDTLTVSYSGDGNYASGTGTASVTVNVSAFTLAASAAAAISSPGGTSSSTITVTSTNGYTGTVTLGCILTNYTAGDIDLPTCTIPSAAVAAGGTATASVTTTSASAELAYPKMDGRGRGWAGAGGGAVLALLLFLGIPARRRSWRTMVGMVVLMVMLGSLAGCGGGGGSTTTPTGTTPDTYTFTVTGTGSPAVTPAPTITFSVTVN